MSNEPKQPPITPTPRYLTAQQVADELQVKIRTVENWRSRAVPYGPPFVHIGGYVRYPADHFNAWCDALDQYTKDNSPKDQT